MRVLHIVRQFHPSVGGLEDFILALAKQQRADGLQPEVLTLNRLTRSPQTRLPAHDVVEGIPVRRIGYFGSARYPIAPAVLKHLAAFDLIHVHAVDFFCDFLALTRPLHRKPLVLSTHGGFFHTPFARSFKKLFFATITRLSLTQYDRVIANSTNDLDIFRRIAGDRRLVMIENGVDTKKFAGLAAPAFTPALLYIGRFSVNKGLDRMVEAFELIADAIPEAKLHIVGNDFDGLYAGLRARIDGLRHGSAIKVHMGLSNEAVRDIVKQCSFFVSASDYEGFGQTVVEAMSAGLLPVVNRIKSFETIVGTTSVGLVTDFTDPAKAARDAVAFMARTAPRYASARAEAIEASGRYDWAGTAKRFAAVYGEVLGDAAWPAGYADRLRTAPRIEP